MSQVSMDKSPPCSRPMMMAIIPLSPNLIDQTALQPHHVVRRNHSQYILFGDTASWSG